MHKFLLDLLLDVNHAGVDGGIQLYWPLLDLKKGCLKLAPFPACSVMVLALPHQGEKENP